MARRLRLTTHHQYPTTQAQNEWRTHRPIAMHHRSRYFPLGSTRHMRALLYRAKEPADPSLLTSEWTWEDEVRELQERMSGLRNLIFKLHTEIELSRQPPDATGAPHDAAIVKDISPKQNPSANGPPSQSVKSHTGPPESDGNLTQRELKLQSQSQHVKERFKSLTRTAESHMYHNEHELTRLREQLSELQTSQASKSSVEDMNASTPSQEPEPHSYTAHHMAEIAYEEDSSTDEEADAQYDIDYEEQMENKCRSLGSKTKRLKQILLIEKKRTEDAKSLLEMATKNGQYWQERFEHE
ncbi:hypothetical protein D6C98_04914 [Aureobasidium pullulans]|uniref:Uncharacterized protein n=1 Tax=Aureobasidium pullulans TaxID=5580 RepID=A0A4S8X130_AURPU|nr:hypothetical protein D6D22_09451 [Aureobasidium pullulans]THY53376.1 hypothetical protein D6C98_04914 [Aureobasidium pullulans]THZ63000.1 hypothetical protein D6C85_09100 [Aureobasidium pullulans]